MQDWHGSLWEILTPRKHLTLDTWHFQANTDCHLFVECPSLWLLQLSSTASSHGPALTASAAILCNSITACYPGPSKKASHWPPLVYNPGSPHLDICPSSPPSWSVPAPTWYTPLTGSSHVVLHQRMKSQQEERPVALPNLPKMYDSQKDPLWSTMGNRRYKP